MAKNITKYQKISLTIAANATLEVNTETKREFERVESIKVECSNSTDINTAIFNDFQINNEEVFPEGFELKILQTGVDLPVNDRFFAIDKRSDASFAAGSKIKIKITAGAVGATYTIYLKLVNPEKK